METNKVLCADEADVAGVVALCIDEGFHYSIDGLMVTFWSAS